MTRKGSNWPSGLLYDLHADGCDGEEYATCHPVVVPEHDEPLYHDRDRGARIEVVMMAWCDQCHAAEWEVV